MKRSTLHPLISYDGSSKGTGMLRDSGPLRASFCAVFCTLGATGPERSAGPYPSRARDRGASHGIRRPSHLSLRTRGLNNSLDTTRPIDLLPRRASSPAVGGTIRLPARTGRGSAPPPAILGVETGREARTISSRPVRQYPRRPGPKGRYQELSEEVACTTLKWPGGMSR